MHKNYIVDVNCRDEEQTAVILKEFADRGDIDVVSCERIRQNGLGVSCFYIRCSTDELENIKNILSEREIELL